MSPETQKMASTVERRSIVSRTYDHDIPQRAVVGRVSCSDLRHAPDQEQDGT
jgi:hypothetical protein